jgi:hypothetical protein
VQVDREGRRLVDDDQLVLLSQQLLLLLLAGIDAEDVDDGSVGQRIEKLVARGAVSRRRVLEWLDKFLFAVSTPATQVTP